MLIFYILYIYGMNDLKNNLICTTLNNSVDLELSNQYLDSMWILVFPSDLWQRHRWPRSEIISTALTMRPGVKEWSVFKTCAPRRWISVLCSKNTKSQFRDGKDHFPRFYIPFPSFVLGELSSPDFRLQWYFFRNK